MNNNNNRSKYSFAPTYGAQKKVPAKKPPAANQPAPKVPTTNQAQGGYYQQPGPGGAVFPPPNTANPYQQPYQQNQPPYQGQGGYQQPQQNYGANNTPPYGYPPSTGQNNPPAYQQPPYSTPAQGNYGGYPVENPYTQPQPASQAPYGQQPAPSYQGNDYGQATSFAPAPYSPYGQDSPTEAPRTSSPQPRQMQDETDIVDKALQGILLIIAPLLFILTLVFSSITFLKWAFVALCVFGLIVMWSKKNFVSSARMVLTLIYVALTAVTLVTIFSVFAADPTQTGSLSGLSAISTPDITSATPPPSSQGEGGAAGDPLGEEGIDPQPEDGNLTPPDSSEAIAQLTAFLDAWVINDNESMLKVSSPKWKSEQQNPQTAFLKIKGVRVASSYEIISAEGSDSEALRNIIVTVTFPFQASEKTYQYNVLMRKENGVWYVDPTTFSTNIPVTATPDPEEEASQPQEEEVPAETQPSGTDPSTVLFYNTDGGKLYHADANCADVGKKYRPLKGIFYYSALGDAAYSKLTPCSTCKAPARP